MGMNLRAFAGAINRCDEVLVPVVFSDHEEAIVWLPVKKAEARGIIDKAKALGVTEINAEHDPSDNCLYIDPGDDEEEPSESEGEEEEEEPAEEEEDEPAEEEEEEEEKDK